LARLANLQYDHGTDPGHLRVEVFVSTNDDKNPYQAPDVAQSPKTVAGDSDFAPCPSCGQRNAKKVGWTFWGGAIGPSLLSHVRCECGTAFNGKTGKSNTTGIVIYVAVTFSIGAALVWYMRSL